MVDSMSESVVWCVARLQQLCRLCAGDTRSSNGHFDCKNSTNLLKTINHLYGIQIRCDDHLSTVICSDCLDEVFHFQSHYKKVQLTQLQFAKYQLMASNTTATQTTFIRNDDNHSDDNQVTSTAQTTTNTVQKQQTIASNSVIQCAQTSIIIGDPVQIQRSGHSESTVITIGEPRVGHTYPTWDDQCSQIFGTMTVTAIPMNAKPIKRPFEFSCDLDKNSQNVPANKQRPCKVSRVSNNKLTDDKSGTSNTVSDVANNAEVEIRLVAANEPSVSSTINTTCRREKDEIFSTKRKTETGSLNVGRCSRVIKVRDLRSMQG